MPAPRLEGPLFQELRARLGSARLLLNGPSKGSEAHTIASKTQKQAFLESLKGQYVALLVQDRANLMSFAAEVSWAADDCVVDSSKTC